MGFKHKPCVQTNSNYINVNIAPYYIYQYTRYHFVIIKTFNITLLYKPNLVHLQQTTFLSIA